MGTEHKPKPPSLSFQPQSEVTSYNMEAYQISSTSELCPSTFPELKTITQGHNLLPRSFLPLLDFGQVSVCPQICHRSLLTRAPCSPSTPPSLYHATHCDRHSKEWWAKGGKDDPHNHSTSITPWQNWQSVYTRAHHAQEEAQGNTTWAQKLSSTTGILWHKWTEASGPSVTAKTSRRCNHVPHFIRRPCTIYMPPCTT